MESFVKFLGSCGLSSHVCKRGIEFVFKLGSGSASGTEGEDHLPEVTFGSLGLLLQVSNLDLIGLDDFLIDCIYLTLKC